jgi:SAM-dependent methyltransferase
MENWFESWFNTSYYHLLYRNRDHLEAAAFLDRLLSYLELKPPAAILDVACGKGRHAIYLNKLGFRVLGIDIAPNNIEQANREAQNQNLQNIGFFVRDMRESYGLGCFDCVCNLFTSIGYFEQESDNLKAIKQFSASLLPGGRLVLDFFNTEKVLQSLKSEDHLSIDGVEFHISRACVNGFIIKTINVDDSGKRLTFYEKVQALAYEQFISYFQEAGLHLKAKFGSYHLEPLDSKSERMIFVLEKPI